MSFSLCMGTIERQLFIIVINLKSIFIRPFLQNGTYNSFTLGGRAGGGRAEAVSTAVSAL